MLFPSPPPPLATPKLNPEALVVEAAGVPKEKLDFPALPPPAAVDSGDDTLLPKPKLILFGVVEDEDREGSGEPDAVAPLDGETLAPNTLGAFADTGGAEELPPLPPPPLVDDAPNCTPVGFEVLVVPKVKPELVPPDAPEPLPDHDPPKVNFDAAPAAAPDVDPELEPKVEPNVFLSCDRPNGD